MVSLGNYVIYITFVMVGLGSYVTYFAFGNWQKGMMIIDEMCWHVAKMAKIRCDYRCQGGVDISENSKNKWWLYMGSVDICKIKWSFYEVFRKSSSPSTVPVQQGTPGNMGDIPGYGQGSLPYVCEKKAYLGNKNQSHLKFIWLKHTNFATHVFLEDIDPIFKMFKDL